MTTETDTLPDAKFGDKKVFVHALVEKLNSSPFMFVADYTGLTVPNFNELRKRLRECQAECHVVKNSYVKIALKEAKLPDLSESLRGQSIMITGEQDVCASAKVMKTFAKEFEKPKLKVGILDGEAMGEDQIIALADLPPREVLLAQLLGVLQAPASKLARIINEPGGSLARVVKAFSEKEG